MNELIGQGLSVMWQGMLGIFIVIFIIAGIVMLMQVFDKKPKSKKED